MRLEHRDVARVLTKCPDGATSYYIRKELRWSADRIRLVLKSMKYNGLVECRDRRMWHYVGFPI